MVREYIMQDACQVCRLGMNGIKELISGIVGLMNGILRLGIVLASVVQGTSHSDLMRHIVPYFAIALMLLRTKLI